MINKSTLVLSFLLLFYGTLPLSAQTSRDAQLALGSIDFPTSGKPDAQKEFVTGVLALHSFWYPEARDHFRNAHQLDPGFAMAYWGEAMTHDHPLWDQHDQEAGKKVLDQLETVPNERLSSLTDREEMFIDAVQALYREDATMDERRRAYADAMQSLADTYPGDDEAAVFNALAAMSVPGFDFSNPDDVVPVAAVLEDVYQRNPAHPGAMHYLIHVYDSDRFAELGLRPAHDYADVAYSSPHAIHMPSHIFKRLKKWEQVIEANIKAYETSVEWQQETGRPIRDRDFHSYRWLFEAYLEIDEFTKACDLLTDLEKMEDRANSRHEDPGRITSLVDRFDRYYREKAGKTGPKCGD